MVPLCATSVLQTQANLTTISIQVYRFVAILMSSAITSSMTACLVSICNSQKTISYAAMRSVPNPSTWEHVVMPYASGTVFIIRLWKTLSMTHATPLSGTRQTTPFQATLAITAAIHCISCTHASILLKIITITTIRLVYF